MPRAAAGFAVGVSLVVGLVLVFAGVAAGSRSQDCGTFNASGHVYGLGGTGVSCSFMTKWAMPLAKKKVPARSPAAPLSGGPAGFKCVGTSKFLASSFPGVGATTQVSGFCRKGKGLSGPYFSWKVKTR
jgi:hypothetical protein